MFVWFYFVKILLTNLQLTVIADNFYKSIFYHRRKYFPTPRKKFLKIYRNFGTYFENMTF